MPGVWLTSDLHLGHRMVSELRGFDSPEAHDAEIARRWRKVIQPEDEVWVLGDISAGGTEAQFNALGILLDLPGRKRLVAGNHDSVHPMHGRKAVRMDPFYRDVFEYTCSAARLNVEGEKLLLSHFPYQGDHTEEPRYREWRLRDEGHWLVHGHTHSSEMWNEARPREIHVGVDAARLFPVNLSFTGRLIKKNRALV